MLTFLTFFWYLEHDTQGNKDCIAAEVGYVEKNLLKFLGFGLILGHMGRFLRHYILEKSIPAVAHLGGSTARVIEPSGDHRE